MPPFLIQSLMRCPPILEWVRAADHQFYQCLVDVLVPDVLRCIPSPLTQAIRNFAKSLEGWLQQALQGCPPQLQQVKVRRRSGMIAILNCSPTKIDSARLPPLITVYLIVAFCCS